MSRTIGSALHLEWTPTWVRAINVVTRDTASGATLSDLGSVVSGHHDVIVGISRNHIFLKVLRLPKALPDDLRRILGVQLGQLFPLPADQLSFDFIQTADQTPEGYLTVVSAMRSEDLRALQAALKQAGLTASRILPICLAASAVATHAGVADALIVEDSPLGFTLDVVQGGIVRFSRVAQAHTDPWSEAQRTLAAANAAGLPIIAAGGLSLPNAMTSAATTLSLLHESPPFFFELAEERIFEAKKRIAARNRLAVLMTISALLLMAFVWVDRLDADAKVAQNKAKWNGQLSRLRRAQSDEIAKAQDATGVQMMLTSAFKPGQSIGDIVAVIGDSLPANAWLTGLNVERGKQLQIRGTANTSNDVANFVNSLGNNPRFRDVKLVFASSAKIGETTVVQFNVTATGTGNVPMPEPDKPGKARTRTTTTTTSTSGAGASQ